MKKILKVIGIVLLGGVILLVGYGGVKYLKRAKQVKRNYALFGKEAPLLNVNGKTYRDLNKNGKLDVYEKPEADLDARIENLLGQMTLEEKAGTMFITMIGFTAKGEPLERPTFSGGIMNFFFSMILPPTSELMAVKNMNSFNTLSSYDAATMAKFNNNIQKLAERTRLGIPATLATDPRHGTIENPGAAIPTPAFSEWPTPLGLAATRDTNLVKEFGDIARQEYRAIGLTLALSPMADLATEPRWARINGTFGEDAELVAEMTKAYVLGFQGDSLSNTSVACMSKHFSGGGPQKNGEDPHFAYGKEQAYPGNNFAYHLLPFVKGALAAHTAAIMPYYGIPMNQTSENVGFSFNKEIITGLLRDSLHYDGLICTDWNIVSPGPLGQPRAWGVEDLTVPQRVKKILDAGVDMFGGENIPETIVALVKNGELSEERVDRSVRRILRLKFILGLFDNPYVDEHRAEKIAGNEAFREKGKEAQARSVVLLKNSDNLLPLKKGTRIYMDGFVRPEVFSNFGKVVNNVADADVVITHIRTPHDKRNSNFLERFFNAGRLYYTAEELEKITDLTHQKPSIVVANLERPAILTEIDASCKALLAEFGSSDEVIADILFGNINPSGKMPFELPSSWEAVQKQLEDVPYDSENPLYAFGYGISYVVSFR